MHHSFDTDLATRLGLNEAILFNYISFWIEKNRANDKNFYDGDYWTYNSVTAFTELFPYLTRKKIRSALNNLIATGMLKTGRYNTISYDRTLWYAIGENAKTLCLIGQIDFTEKANRDTIEGKPIPVIKPVNIPINTISENSSNPSLDDIPKKSIQSTKVDYESFLEKYHSELPNLPRVHKLTSKRKTIISTFMKTFTSPEVEAGISNIRKSDFLMGKVNNFKANFDFIFNVNNFAKILDGNYNKKGEACVVEDMETENLPEEERGRNEY